MNARGLDLTIEGLTVVYGGVTALDDVKISVPSGGFVTVSGCKWCGQDHPGSIHHRPALPP